MRDCCWPVRRAASTPACWSRAVGSPPPTPTGSLRGLPGACGASGMIATLAPEVASYDPRAALDGGADGLDAYRAILALLPSRLAPQGVAVLEVGAGQHEAVDALVTGAGMAISRVGYDLAG